MHTYRVEKIYKLLLSRERVSVAELAEMFQVTPTTIRRDLITMEEQGLAQRTRGFAVAASDTRRAIDFELFQDEKRRIAQAALSFISEGMSIAMDAGTTIGALTEVMMETKTISDLDIVTNALNTAIKLSNRFRLCMPGGAVLHRNAVVVGTDVAKFFADINVDLAFLGTTGIENSNGLTVSYPLHLGVKEAIVGCANKKIALLDSSKFIGRGIFTFCKFKDLDVIITVKTAQNEKRIKQIEREGVEFVLV